MELHTAAGMPPSFAACAWLGPPCLQQGALQSAAALMRSRPARVGAQVINLRHNSFPSLARVPAGVDLEVELVAMVCHSAAGPGHEVTVVRHGPWLCVSDGKAVPVAGDLAATGGFMEARRRVLRIGFYAAPGGAAPGLRKRRKRRQR